jgi:hypothetical protein
MKKWWIKYWPNIVILGILLIIILIGLLTN